MPSSNLVEVDVEVGLDEVRYNLDATQMQF